MRSIDMTSEVQELLDQKAPVAVGVSGGKDSHAVAWAMSKLLEDYEGPKVLIHSDLGSVEWLDSLPACERIAEATGWELMTCARKAGGMMERWESRWESSTRRYVNMETVCVVLPWSTPAMRFCTSELKVDPITSALKKRFGKVPMINVTGIRAEESSARAKQPIVSPGAKLPPGSISWRPIHSWLLEDVWEAIRESGVDAHEAYTRFGSSRVSCRFCFSGDTEVVTRAGIKPIKELAGTTPELLIPKQTPLGLSGEGHFRAVPVRNLGAQRLWAVILRRGKTKKVVAATREHRWFVERKTGNRSIDKTTEVVEHSLLRPGDRLRSLRAHTTRNVGEVPFGVAQGFVFGDGAKGAGRRPAELTFYDLEKDSAMLPYFAQHEIRDGTANGGKKTRRVYGLPRTWKDTPSMSESRSFLLSWLAGYFAADGTVSKVGSARLDSSDLECLKFARSVAAICGVGYGPITHASRKGLGQEGESRLYHFNLDPDTLPEWFFKILKHRDYVRNRTGRGAGIDRVWKVEEIVPLHRTEEVYCAEVEGEAAFGLSDELMTGNCILANEADLKASLTDPRAREIYVRMCDLELESGFAFQGSRWLTTLGMDIVPNGYERLRAAQDLAEKRNDAQAWLPKHLQFTRGWPKCVPTTEECEDLAEMRRTVANLYDWDVMYTSAQAVHDRYQELWDIKQEKEAKKKGKK